MSDTPNTSLGPRHFDAHAEIYDRGRPPYPRALWARLRELDLLRPGVRVIELGAGTGLATGPMLAAGAAVTAVEPGRELADRLRARHPRATLLLDTAENVRLPTSTFDLAVAATSVHWFDLDTVLPELHRALVSDGCFAVWRNAFGDPNVPVTPFREQVERIVARRGERDNRPGPGELDTDMWVDRLTDSGHFEATHIEHFRWSIDLGTDRIRDLFTTFSDWRPAEVDEAASAVRALGGVVTEHYLTPLIVLRRA
ncbi:class I SAM-dependent methyltransferase [Nocardia bovistercoris]|uniref:Class I SAM-dependent methyltransferase n=1 Tax=Nocardia bovistercoris TaxID=2785916 RepID=A0A931IAQ7_9NOCA|nr:class I SAM-dependent methyltransferase [Nocardia bovistercoris]MBH0777166.1 class I SAM-dependent methyltransferase [Nocardia bovistercoris]